MLCTLFLDSKDRRGFIYLVYKLAIGNKLMDQAHEANELNHIANSEIFQFAVDPPLKQIEA